MNALDGLKYFGDEYLKTRDTFFRNYYEKTSSLMIVNEKGEAICKYLKELLEYDSHNLIMKLVAKTLLDKINMNELDLVADLIYQYNSLVMIRQYDNEIPVLELKDDKVCIRPIYFKCAGQNMVGIFIYETKSFVKLKDYEKNISKIENEEIRQFKLDELYDLKDEILDLDNGLSFY